MEAALDWDLDEGEKRACVTGIEDASNWARHLGSEAWVDSTSTPPMVITLVRKSVSRMMKNLQGLETSRAGDETMGWFEGEDKGDNAGQVYFTEGEQETLAILGHKRKTSIASVGTYAFNGGPNANTDPTGYVPTDAGKVFPFFQDGYV
jgi:hypothetical protein